MAINCIINYILSQSVSFSGESPSTQRKWGGNDDPPTRPNVFFLTLHAPPLFFSPLPRCKTLWQGWQKIEAVVAEIPHVPSTLNIGSDVSLQLCTKLQYIKKTNKKQPYRYCHFFLSPCQSNHVSSSVLARWVVSIPHNSFSLSFNLVY